MSGDWNGLVTLAHWTCTSGGYVRKWRTIRQPLVTSRPCAAMVTAWCIPMSVLPRKLQTRLLLTYFVLTCVGLGGLIVWMGLRLQTAVFERAAHDLHVQALVMVNMLSEPLEQWQASTNVSHYALEALVRSYAHSVGARITVL